MATNKIELRELAHWQYPGSWGTNTAQTTVIESRRTTQQDNEGSTPPYETSFVKSNTEFQSSATVASTESPYRRKQDSDYACPTIPSPQPFTFIRRQRTIRDTELSNGNLVLNWPVPKRVSDQIPPLDSFSSSGDEFTRLRYSAVTCHPSEFQREQFTLRQQLFPTPRHTEILIAVLIQDEDEDWSRNGAVESLWGSIDHICSMTNEKMWSQEGWKKIVVCIVWDGRARVHPRTRAILASLGVYQHGIARDSAMGRNVTAHVYEYTTHVRVEWTSHRYLYKLATGMPIQMLFCVKERKCGRIDSLKWVSEAFGNVLQPTMTFIVDGGTILKKDSIYHLWRALDSEPMCAAACGLTENSFSIKSTLLNPLMAVHHFEDKWSSIIDQPFESSLGFVKVIPVGMSAYRSLSVENENGPLTQHLKSETIADAPSALTISSRWAGYSILPFEILAQSNYQWLLRYVHASEAKIEVPHRISDFFDWQQEIAQSRTFASLYAIINVHRLWGTKHSAVRKFLVLFGLVHRALELVMLWFSIVWRNFLPFLHN